MNITRQHVPIIWLTIRQFLEGKAVRVVIGLALVPFVFGLIYLIQPDRERPDLFLGNGVFIELMIPTLLPLTVLVLATSAFGNEIEDRTLPFLTLKPVSRFRIVIEKLAGSVLVSGPIVVLGLTLTYLVVMRGDSGAHVQLLWAMIVASLVATITYSSIFMLVSLLISRALVAALIYLFVWESILGRFVPGLRYVSIRHFVASIFAAVAKDPRFALNDATGLSAAVATLAIASIIAVALATWRLRTMNLT
jgi:ABC-2 type transport system permease protein